MPKVPELLSDWQLIQNNRTSANGRNKLANGKACLTIRKK